MAVISVIVPLRCRPAAAPDGGMTRARWVRMRARTRVAATPLRQGRSNGAMRLRAAIVVGLAAFAVSAPARAATVHVGPAEGGASDFFFEAGPGEANRLTLAFADRAMVVS